jgi:hypothetical protein
MSLRSSFHQSGQRSATPTETALDRLDGYTLPLRDLSISQIAPLAQYERCPELGTKLQKRRLDQLGGMDLIRERRRHRGRLRKLGIRQVASATDYLEGRISSDAMKPRRETSRPSERAKRAPSCDRRILQSICGVIGIPTDAIAHRPSTISGVRKERTESLLVAGPRVSDECRLVGQDRPPPPIQCGRPERTLPTPPLR